jgi:hypothetical protein
VREQFVVSNHIWEARAMKNKLPENQPSEIEQVDRPEIEIEVPHPDSSNTTDGTDGRSTR